jgi:hypothetical protein
VLRIWAESVYLWGGGRLSRPTRPTLEPRNLVTPAAANQVASWFPKGRLPVFSLLFALSKSLIHHGDCRSSSIVSLFFWKNSLFPAEKQGEADVFLCVNSFAALSQARNVTNPASNAASTQRPSTVPKSNGSALHSVGIGILLESA